VVGGAALAYVLLYPEDLAAVLATAEPVLHLSHAVAPGLYAVLGALVLVGGAVRIWGAGSGRRAATGPGGEP
jgi:hypothetical protein